MPASIGSVVYHDPASMEAEIFKILRINILIPQGRRAAAYLGGQRRSGRGQVIHCRQPCHLHRQGVEETVLLMDCAHEAIQHSPPVRI